MTTNTPAQTSREARLAAKLRENLHRRKAQARALDPAPDAPREHPASGESAAQPANPGLSKSAKAG